MADGTSIPADGFLSARAISRRPNSMRRYLARRSTTAFLLASPLILLIGALVVWPAFYAIDLSMLNKKMTQFVTFDNFHLGLLEGATPSSRWCCSSPACSRSARCSSRR